MSVVGFSVWSWRRADVSFEEYRDHYDKAHIPLLAKLSAQIISGGPTRASSSPKPKVMSGDPEDVPDGIILVE